MSTDIGNKNKTSTETISFSDRIDEFVESLQMGEKYGVVRIDWVLNNDIKGLKGGDSSWSDEKNWENPSYTKVGIAKGALKMFMERDASPISFLAEYCKENKLYEESFFFPIVSDDSTPNTSVNSSRDNSLNFQLLKLRKECEFISNEIENVISEESKNFFPLNSQEDDDNLNKFLQYQESYVKILMKTSRRIFSSEPMLAINSAIIIPVITRSVSNSRMEILGAYMIITSTFNSKALKDNDNFMHDLQALKYACKSQVDEKISQRFYEQLRKESIKSAKAAIMSRNLSHNLGSHVMSYLKQSLKSVADMEKSGALEEFSAKGKELPSIGKEQEKPELPYLVGTGRFISYLQERQDYIATVSTDYIPYPSVVNFKDAIYDELNPDYRFRRHTEWKGHKPANILLENIARSEGLSRQAVDDQKGNNIILRYRNFDGLNINDAKIDYDNLRRWNFSLPGGIMGRQAVFSIVENVIRNAAKHGARNAGDDLIVTFDIIDPFDSNELNGFDNIFKARFNKEKFHDIDDLYIVTLTTNTKADGDVLKKIIRAINASLVDEGGNLNKSNKGIKEMVISAAWLRNLRIEELDRKTRSTITPILWVRSVEGNLQYVFCLPRVKEVALITDDNNSLLAKKDDNLWKSNGWYVYTLKEYEDLSSRNFNFVILDKNLYGKKEEARQCSTNRFFVEAETTNLSHQEIKFSMDECKDYDEEKLDKALRGLYEQLAGSKNDIIIAISDESVTDIESAHVVDIQRLSSKENSLYKYKYIYRKHNDTKVEFDKLVNIYSSGSDWGELEFVEGITGGNSTDRLIRHTVIDDLWAFKHFHAMNTKVAIFDERLFAYTTGIELSVLQSAHMDWDGILKDKNDDEARSYVKSFDNLHSRLISTDRELRVEFRNYDKKSVLTFAKAHYSSYAIIPVIDVSSEVGHKKKIDLFTLTKAKDGLLIWGVSFANQRKADVYGNVEVVGKIVFKINNDKTLPIVIRNDEYGMMYDYISLHQGLLDKVYEAFPKQLVSSEGKLEVTKAIYNKFVNPQEESNDYLRGMSIHSGRSKPNEKDMPQHQPFLQYSAIENAFSDCKYTLVEVLDFACFEKHNNE